MTRLRTLSDLQDALDADHAWRLKELSNYWMTTESASAPLQKSLLRAGVPLLYAHWEGFVKYASVTYVKYVGNMKLCYNDLSPCFVVFGAKKHLKNLSDSKKSLHNIEAVKFFIESMGEQAQFMLASAVNTESNLSSSVFENIAMSIGLDLGPYRTRFNLIDESLLKRRNSIAHGEYLELNAEEFHGLREEVLGLTRQYKNDVLRAADNASYRR